VNFDRSQRFKIGELTNFNYSYNTEFSSKHKKLSLIPSGLPTFGLKGIKDLKDFVKHFKLICNATGMPESWYISLFKLCLESSIVDWLEGWIDKHTFVVTWTEIQIL
jgi:hypothetical protein